MKTTRLYRLLAIIGLVLSFSFSANAGHLFTQATANTPINLTSGTGIQVTQLTYEGGSNNGSVSVDMDQTGSIDPTIAWSAGDAVRITIGSWVQNFAFDTLTTDFAGASQDGYGFDVNDPTLIAENITPGGASTQFTVLATAGQFTFEGYRIDVVGDKYNGTGAGPINQSQVVTAAQLSGGGAFEPAAESPQTALGTHLDAINGSVTGDLATVITVMAAMTDESKALAMKLISPEQSQALGQSAANTVSTSFDTVQVRLDALRVGGAGPTIPSASHGSGLSSGDETSSILEHHMWLKAIGGTADQKSKDGFAGSDSDYHGVMGGLDITTESDLTVGAAFAYARSNVNMNDFRNGDGADIDTYQLTGYFNKPIQQFYLEGMLTYAYHNFNTTRNTHLTGIASGDFNGNMLAARLISGLPIALANDVTLTPYLGVEGFHSRQNAYTETGAGALSLDVSSNTANRFRSLAGAKLATNKQLADGSVLTPMVQLNWRHEFRVDGINTTSSFLGGGGNFESVGQNVERNVYGLSGRLNWAKTDSLSLGVELGGETASGYRSYNGQLYGNWKF
jgi:outer membrane autotransporter protein